MVKNLLQDVVPPPKRSIRNVPVPSYRKKVAQPKVSTQEFEEETRPIKKGGIEKDSLTNGQKKLRLSDMEMAPPIMIKTKKGRWKIWLLLIIVLIIGFAVLMGTFFARAEVLITPKQQKVTVSEVVRAGDTTEGVPYEIITLTKIEGKSVSATESETVEERASGTIVIYNNHNSAPQRLVKNTRFETTEGLIYRIQDSVTVPGQTTKDGKTVPGSIEAIVYADSPGEKYNIIETDFTIPGFKGDPKYKTFYARSKTPMAGGFIGVRKKVSESVRESTVADLKNILITKLTQEIKEQVPNNFIMFDEAVFTEFENAPQTDVTDSSVTINIKGTARVAIFDKDLLETFISDKTAPAFNNEEVEFSGITNLKVTIGDKQSVDIKKHQIFEISIEGDGIIWTVFPEERIKSELAGNSKSILQTVFSQYSSIEEARAKFSPFWKRSFPKNIEDISIVRVFHDK